jgi:Putative addiction module component
MLSTKQEGAMSANAEKILQEALNLSPKDRAEVLERLLATFQVPPDPELDRLWAQEAEDRLAAYDRGELSTFLRRKSFPESIVSAANED